MTAAIRTLRTCWTGDDPEHGDYLISAGGRRAYRIDGVSTLHEAMLSKKPRLSLAITAMASVDVPAGAMVHPWTRTAGPSEADMQRRRDDTAAVILSNRQRQRVQDIERARRVGTTDRTSMEGAGKLMAAAWRDPDDVRPNTRKAARSIEGYRTACPLRHVARKRGSSITELHIHAADHLRRVHDVARLGYSPPADWTGVHAQKGPRSGPGRMEHARSEAGRDLLRTLRRFAPAQRVMIGQIILECATIPQWCRNQQMKDGAKRNPQTEMGKLIAILDMLVTLYESEIERDMAEAVDI